MPGYSSKPLVGKLDIKPSARVLLDGAPRDFARLLEPVPEGAAIVAGRVREVDVVLAFVTEAKVLATRCSVLAAKLPAAGVLWVAWPKKSARVPTDLTENVVRDIGLAAGLVDVKVCAITDVWSGLKFVRRLRDR